MAVGYNPRMITNGLVAYWDAGNTKSYPGSGITWTDIIGNRAVTLYNGPTFSNNKLVFDGLDDHGGGAADIKWTPDGSIGYSTLTIEVWVKTSDTAGNFYSKPWNGSGQYNIRVAVDALYLHSFSGSTGLSHPTTLSDGNWKQVVCWMNATQFGTYVNGGLFSSSANHGLSGGAGDIGDLNLVTSFMSLYPYGAGWAGNASFSINGEMSNVIVYNRVLSVSEIKQNFNALRGRFGI